MATMRYSFFSQVLSLCTDVTITYPDRQFDYCESPRLERIVARERRQALRPGMKLQTVYVLHGGSDDDTLIHRYTNLERYAEENCVMTVTPQVKDSFFIDTKYGFRYYTYLTEELPRVIPYWLVLLRTGFSLLSLSCPFRSIVVIFFRLGRGV